MSNRFYSIKFTTDIQSHEEVREFIQEMRDRWFCNYEYLKHAELKDFALALAYLDNLLTAIEEFNETIPEEQPSEQTTAQSKEAES